MRLCESRGGGFNSPRTPFEPDKETWRQGEVSVAFFSMSPCLLVSVSAFRSSECGGSARDSATVEDQVRLLAGTLESRRRFQLLFADLFQLFDLRAHARAAVGLPGMLCVKIAMIILGRIEGLERHDVGDDWDREDAGVVDLLLVQFRQLPVSIVVEEDPGSVLRAEVGALAITRGGAVGAREDFEKFRV